MTTAHGNIASLYKNEDYASKTNSVEKSVDNYNKLFEDDADGSKRKEHYMDMVNQFYDIVTDFYEYGWGHSFHFASRFKGETFSESIKRSEYFLALKLGLKPGMKVMDVGCGIGGPMRAVAQFSGASVIGINNNEYQIKRGNRINDSFGLNELCSFIQSDFMNLKVPSGSFDAAFAVEATCHAPDKTACFKEIYRTLKPGAYFAVYEWCMTDKYDPKNPKHNEIKFGIEEGNGLPDIVHYSVVDKAFKEAGFELIESFDTHNNLHDQHQIPWYTPLSANLSLDGFVHTEYGHYVTTILVSTLERLGVAPKGSAKVQEMLQKTARYLVQAGKTEIFTPDYFVLGRKPLNAKD